MPHTRKIVVFLCPKSVLYGREGDGYTTPARENPSAACSRFLAFPATTFVVVKFRLDGNEQMNTHTAQIIPLFTKNLQGETVQLCNARDLHTKLQVGKDFSTWITDRIKEYKLIEGEDFHSILGKNEFSPDLGKNDCSPETGVKRGRGRPAKDYCLTIDTAKELAMIENNDQGRAIRKYFIAVEKEARRAGLLATETITPAQQNALQQIIDRLAGGDNRKRPALWSRFNNHFKLGGYKQLPAVKFEEAAAYLEGLSGEYLPKPEPVNALRELPAEPQASPLDAIFSAEVQATRQKFYKWLDACRAQMIKAGIEEPAWPDVDVEQLALAMMGEQIGMMRFQLFIDRHHKLHVSTIPREARITTAEQLPDMIANGGAQVPKALLPKIIEAVAKRMQC
jgi:anti-repressor protein